MTTQLTTTWHINPDTIDNDQPYAVHCKWTRHRPPEQWVSTRQVRNFTEGQRVMAVAVHEAAHTVMHLYRGVEVLYAQVDDGPDAGGRMSYKIDENRPYEIESTAAGERAEDRWLRESGLWTEGRAWVAERVAWGDRTLINELVPGGLTYGTDKLSILDYSNILDRTDELLDGLWWHVMQLANCLAEYRYMNGDEAAAVTGLTNYKQEVRA